MQFDSASLKVVELYTFEFTSGISNKETLKFTSSNTQIGDYIPIPIKRGSVDFNIELEVPKIDITIANHAFKLKDDKLTIIEGVRAGYFNKCKVTIEYYNVDTQEKSVFWYGFIDKEIRYTRDEIIFSVYSLIEKLNISIPKIMYQEQCNLKLYSERCGVNKESYKFIGEVVDIINNKTLVVSYTNRLPEQDYLKFGYLIFTSGENTGIGVTITGNKNEDGHGIITINKKLAFNIAIGDVFEAYAGCDKSGKTCHEKFNNYANFLGFEYIPRPEVML